MCFYYYLSVSMFIFNFFCILFPGGPSSGTWYVAHMPLDYVYEQTKVFAVVDLLTIISLGGGYFGLLMAVTGKIYAIYIEHVVGVNDDGYPLKSGDTQEGSLERTAKDGEMHVSRIGSLETTSL